MTTTPPTLIPYLAVSDARAAIEFYTSVFGAELDPDEYYEMEDGRIGHATLAVGAGRFYLSDEYPELGAVSPDTVGGSTIAVVINVPDADATYSAAVSAGATGQRPPEDGNGGRSGWLIDPWGHRWSPFGPAKGAG